MSSLMMFSNISNAKWNASTIFADVDDFQDTAPVADEYLSSSTFGARGNIAQSLLLPSDADQMLRV